jgi:hypothetical protein
MGPEPASTVLSAEQEAIAVAFRRHTLLALDDCLHALQATIPHLSRSALHRCFQRHGINRLPLHEDGQSSPKKKFKDYPIGCLHVDFAEVRTEEGRQYLFVAIDRTSKVAFAEPHPRATRMVAADFLRCVLGRADPGPGHGSGPGRRPPVAAPGRVLMLVIGARSEGIA